MTYILTGIEHRTSIKCSRQTKKEKRIYNERALQTEMELLSPMLFAVNDAMGLECYTVFSKTAALKFLEKKDIQKSVVRNSIIKNINFYLL